MSRTSLHAAALGLVTLCHAAIAWYWQPSLEVFPIDDPYIHLVYGANFADGQGFAFNRGEPSMGTSSPFWTLVVAGLTRWSSDVIAAVCTLGSLLFLASAVTLYVLIFQVLARNGREPPVAAATATLGALVLLTSGNALWISFSGMETSLYLALTLLAVVLHVAAAPPVALGFVLALAVLTRLSGLYLIGALVLERIATRGRLDPRALAPLTAPLAALALFGACSWLTVGTFLPTTVGGKKATYVSGDFDLEQAFRFAVDYFSFLEDQPVYLVLVGLLLVHGLFSLYRAATVLHQGQPARFGANDLLSTWAFAHLAVFALTFRSLLHYGRYFVVLMPPAIAVGAWVADAVAGKLGSRSLRFAPAALLGLLCAVNVLDLPRWKALYHHDLRHIRETYLQSARWVSEHTPHDAVIAAYDIGVLKHYSGRRIVDLFGLLDEHLHPLLRKRDAASYLHASKADYVLYLQSPNSEHHTRVYLAEYGRDALLDQRLLASFRSEPYPQPTVTQSFEVNAFEIRGWHPVNAAGRRRQFLVNPDEIETFDPVGVDFGRTLQLLGVTFDMEQRGREYLLRRVLRVPTLGFRVTMYWRVLDGQRRLPDVELSFADARTGWVWHSVRHAIAHGRVDGLVRPGEIVREPHFIWLPPEVPNGPLAVRVRASTRGSGEPLRVGPTRDTAITAATLRILAPEHVGL